MCGSFLSGWNGDNLSGSLLIRRPVGLTERDEGGREEKVSLYLLSNGLVHGVRQGGVVHGVGQRGGHSIAWWSSESDGLSVWTVDWAWCCCNYPQIILTSRQTVHLEHEPPIMVDNRSENTI